MKRLVTLTVDLVLTACFVFGFLTVMAEIERLDDIELKKAPQQVGAVPSAPIRDLEAEGRYMTSFDEIVKK